MCVRAYAHESAGAHGVQKRTLNPLELDLQVVVSHQTCVLGTKLRSFARAECTLNTKPSLQSLGSSS